MRSNRLFVAILFLVLGLGLAGCPEGSSVQTDGSGDDTADVLTGDAGVDAEPLPDTAADAEPLPDTTAPDTLEPDVALPDALGPDAVEPDSVEPVCEVDGDCDDEDWCTTDSCIDGLCFNQGKDCDDDDLCTADGCDPDTGLCAYEAVDCDDGNDCTVESCKPATGCEYVELEDCCAADVVVAWDMEEDIEGLDLVNLGPEASADVAWALSDAKPYSGLKSLYFGDPAAMNYDSGARVRGTATFPPALVPEGVEAELRFFAYLDVEAPTFADVFTVYVVQEDGTRIPVVAKTAQTSLGEWDEWVVYLNAYAGQVVRIEFYFDSFNAAENLGEGVFIDDLRIAGRCALPDPCVAKVDCNDLNPCSADACADGACTYALDAACCMFQAQCDDDDPCTIEECIDGSCQYVITPNCCTEDADCTDADECTTGKCTEGICFQIPSGADGCCETDADCDDLEGCTVDSCSDGTCINLNVCCYEDAECDDGDDICTTDSCVDGDCVYQPTGVEGCCLEMVLDEDFEGPIPGWTFSPMNDGNVGWQVWDGGPDSDGSALYYGNILTENFDNGQQNTGAVISPEIWLQPGTDNMLGFDLFMDTESGLTYDIMQIFVDWTGNDTWILVWDKSALVGMSAWASYGVDLSGLAGETIRLRLWFDSDDNMSNDSLGVLVDNLTMSSSCLPKTCAADADCADDVPGTIGTCSDGLCVYEISEEPCGTALDCDDDDQCTIDTCEIAFCEHTPAEDCCYALADCDDGNLCTTDACDAGNLPAPQCTHDWAPGCCMEDADCDDGNPCTADVCPGEGEQCTNPWIDGCCLADPDCDDDDPCTLDDCSENECVNQYYCCESDADCDDGDDVCTTDSCLNGFCEFLPSGAEGCCEPLIYEEGFDGGLGAWTLTGGNETYYWQESTVQFQSGLSALYFGNAAADSYGNSQDATATSPEIELPDQPGLAVNFWIWFDTETNFDDLSVAVVLDDGSETVLGEFTGHDGQEWTEVSFDVSAFAGQSIYLRFTFHSDSSVAGYPGAWVDSLTVTQFCCSDDADCDDGNECTTDSCPGAESLCINLWEAGCCLKDADCDDDDPCTMDDCSGPGGSCTHTNICCDGDADCDDDDDVCTDDSCVDGYCQFLPSGAAGCCTPLLYENDFEGGLSDWTIENSALETGWALSSAKSVSGSHSLAYTNAAGDSYGNSNDGTCLSPALELPDQPGLHLEFQLWYEIESCCDEFLLSVVHPGGTTLIATYAGTNAAEWQQVSFDASPYKGQSVQLLMEFNCDSSVSYDGVFIDDLKVTQDCCSDDADCDDGNACTLDSCPGVDSLCINQWQAGCCNVNGDCDDDDACTQDVCTDMVCGNTWICCEADGDCDDGDDVCTDDACVDSYCEFTFNGTAGCCEEKPYEDLFDGQATAWTFSAPDNGVGWNIWDTPPEGDAPVLYYGNPDTANFDSGGINAGDATSGPVTLPVPGVGYDLSFDVYIDGESSTSYDRPTLFVSWLGAAGPWVEIWSKADYDTGTMSTWQSFSLDVSGLAGQTVYFRWTFETVDAITNLGLGAMVDNFIVSSPCLALTCVTDGDCVDDVPGTDGACAGTCGFVVTDQVCEAAADCDDGDLCTLDDCVSNVCDHVPAEDCCYEDGDCDDGNPCTADACDLENSPAPVCVAPWVEECCLTNGDCFDGEICTVDTCPGEGETCTYPEIESCCLSDADCVDDDICTEDTCIANTCHNDEICCVDDLDCDDGDDLCTDDACVEGYCENTFTGAQGCCIEPVFRDDFSSLTGWTLDQNWEIGPTAAGPSPEYGNPNPDFDHTASGDNIVLGVFVGGIEPGDTVYGPFYATSPVVDLSGTTAPHVSMWRWLNSDYTPWMVNTIDAFDGAVWQNLWITGASPGIEDDAWVHMDFDVTAHKSPTFQLRIGYEVLSTAAFAYTGWNVDDVQVYEAGTVAGGDSLCCAYDTDCQGLYPAGVLCSSGQCILP